MIVCFGKKMESLKIPSTNDMQYLHFYFCSFEQIDQKKCLGWNHVNTNVSWAHIVHCRLLNDVVMHKYIYMIGRCLKDQGEEHFQFYYRNVSFKEMQYQIDEYL